MKNENTLLRKQAWIYFASAALNAIIMKKESYTRGLYSDKEMKDISLDAASFADSLFDEYLLEEEEIEQNETEE